MFRSRVSVDLSGEAKTGASSGISDDHPKNYLSEPRPIAKRWIDEGQRAAS